MPSASATVLADPAVESTEHGVDCYKLHPSLREGAVPKAGELVVYLLGAGFSEPLGLPVMGTFFEKATDMLRLNPDRYEYFKEVIALRDRFAAVRSYFKAELLNIEELLSMYQMEAELAKRSPGDLAERFVRDVVTYYTPRWAPPAASRPANWWDAMWGDSANAAEYGGFIGSLLRLEVSGTATIAPAPSQNGEPSYGVLTLNYDRVLESLCENASGYVSTPEGVAFATGSPTARHATPLIKLHGDVAEGHLVPPTWGKDLDQAVLPAWQAAYALLAEASHVRVIGYSLPPADHRVELLLKTALAKTRYLKKLDVICLDDGQVRKRYEALVDPSFRGFRFSSVSTSSYLSALRRENEETSALKRVISGLSARPFARFERAHEKFFSAGPHA